LADFAIRIFSILKKFHASHVNLVPTKKTHCGKGKRMTTKTGLSLALNQRHFLGCLNVSFWRIELLPHLECFQNLFEF
jgi:hypothetical protein